MHYFNNRKENINDNVIRLPVKEESICCNIDELIMFIY